MSSVTDKRGSTLGPLLNLRAIKQIPYFDTMFWGFGQQLSHGKWKVGERSKKVRLIPRAASAFAYRDISMNKDMRIPYPTFLCRPDF